MLLLAVGLVFVIAGAPLIMALFGPHYAKEGVGLLRVLALSCLPGRWLRFTWRSPAPMAI
jgi:hypothetical protein